jgi:DNA-binding response OmpR family regulator
VDLGSVVDGDGGGAPLPSPDSGDGDVCADDATTTATANSAAAEEEEEEEGRRRMRRRSDGWIVLVDDEPAIRLAVGDYLRSAGYATVTACDGPTSFLDLCLTSCSWSLLLDDDCDGTSSPPWMGNGERCDDDDDDDDSMRWRLPDCVVSDIRMPGGIDGIELLRLMRRRPPPPPPPPPVEDGDDDDALPPPTTTTTPLPRRGRGRPRKDGSDYYAAAAGGDNRDGSYDGKDEYDLLATIVDGGGGGGGGGGLAAAAAVVGRGGTRITTPADQAMQRMDAIHGCISHLLSDPRRGGKRPPAAARGGGGGGSAVGRMMMRRPESLRDVPVILLTARAMVSDRIVGYGAGADGYLPKPFRPEELVGMIDNLLRRREQEGGRRSDDTGRDDGGGSGYDDGVGGGVDGGEQRDLTAEQAREIADDLVEIKELIRASSRWGGRRRRGGTSMEEGNDLLRDELRHLLTEAIWMYRTGERRKRVFTRDHIKSILSSCYDFDLASRKNAGWEILRKELEGRCSEHPERLSRLDTPV